MVACHLHDLHWKNRKWDWTSQHTGALNIPEDRLKIYQKLGQLHPQDLLKVEWGFAERASCSGIFQKGPQRLARPFLFYWAGWVLLEWYSVLPTLESIQTDNGIDLTAAVVQDWTWREIIKRVFHISYYPHANGIVELTNGLIKKHTDVLQPTLDMWVT